MFRELRDQIRKQYATMTSLLLVVDLPKNHLNEIYLSSFEDAEEKQSHTCNCCRRFLNRFGGIVTVKDGIKTTIWDNIEVPEIYRAGVQKMREAVLNAPIANPLYHYTFDLGTEKNTLLNTRVEWEHFHLRNRAITNRAYIPTVRTEAVNQFVSCNKALEQFSVQSIELVLTKMENGELNRASEKKSMVQGFLTLKKEYELCNINRKKSFVWEKMDTVHKSILEIRSDVVGSMLIELSEGMDIAGAVRSYNSKVSGHTYMRTNTVASVSQLQQAKNLLEKEDLLQSLERKIAASEEFNINNALFCNSENQLKDIFASLIDSRDIDPKKVSAEEIAIEDFIKNVLPGSRSMEVLLENKHLDNLVAITSPFYENTKSLFKWSNPFGWAYTNNVADSVKEKVKRAGGNVNGALRISLRWYSGSDYDLHLTLPYGTKIDFRNKQSTKDGAKLDVDMNAGGASNSVDPVENIVLVDKSKIRDGFYKVEVDNFAQRTSRNDSFDLEIEYKGKIYNFYHENTRLGRHVEKGSFYMKNGVLQFKENPVESNKETSVNTNKKWNLETQRYHKVNFMSLSPNHWGGHVGQKHYMFFLENCKPDEELRGFFNEQLNSELLNHRKAIDLVGSKMKLNSEKSQLAGIGFSENQRNDVIVKVDVKNYKIKF